MQNNSDLIIRDCCEAEVAEFDKPDTICITLDVLREIVQRHYPGPCLHQIQEPAAAEQAAWHAGLDEGRAQAAPAAVAVPDGWKLVPVQDTPSMWTAGGHAIKSCGGHERDAASLAYKAMLAAAPALAATPAAVEVPAEGDPAALVQLANVLESGRALIQVERKEIANALRTLAATPAAPAAAAPVLLPEPSGCVVYADSQAHHWYANQECAELFVDREKKNGAPYAFTYENLYTEQQVRALLATATGLPAQAVEPSDAELIALNAGECFFSESPSKYPELGHGTQYHGGAPGVIGFARAALELRADPAAYSQKFQQRVQPWMMACFGPEISADRIERNHRFLEEALELVQSCGCTASEAHQLVDYVYGRPWGEPAQEAGGVMVTRAALCLANGLDMHACGETELARIWTKVEAIRAKQAAKPKHSPLPEHAPQAQADARDAALEAGEQDALRLVRQAVRDFHYALDNRKHGGVAAGEAMNAIELALNMYWQQGQEADRRAAIAAAKGEA